jgi:hypothetical protein
MPMTEARAGDQVVHYDREATAAIYAGLKHGNAEECGCVFCRNFAAQRDLVYPASFRELLAEIGIDADKEFEAFQYGPVGDGIHRYGGWFYFVGEMVTWGERNVNPPDAVHYFDFFFTSGGPPAPAFRGLPHLAIEFTADLKWVVPEPPEYRTASKDTRSR